jgi:hypothetical protein
MTVINENSRKRERKMCVDVLPTGLLALSALLFLLNRRVKEMKKIITYERNNVSVPAKLTPSDSEAE